MKWYEYLEPQVREHVEYHIIESSKHHDAIRKSKTKANAQLWTVIGNLSRQILLLHEKIDKFEKSFEQQPKTVKKDVVKKKEKKKNNHPKSNGLTKSLEKL